MAMGKFDPVGTAQAQAVHRRVLDRGRDAPRFGGVR